MSNTITTVKQPHTSLWVSLQQTYFSPPRLSLNSAETHGTCSQGERCTSGSRRSRCRTFRPQTSAPEAAGVCCSAACLGGVYNKGCWMLWPDPCSSVTGALYTRGPLYQGFPNCFMTKRPTCGVKVWPVWHETHQTGFTLWVLNLCC